MKRLFLYIAFLTIIGVMAILLPKVMPYMPIFRPTECMHLSI